MFGIHPTGRDRWENLASWEAGVKDQSQPSPENMPGRGGSALPEIGATVCPLELISLLCALGRCVSCDSMIRCECQHLWDNFGSSQHALLMTFGWIPLIADSHQNAAEDGYRSPKTIFVHREVPRYEQRGKGPLWLTLFNSVSCGCK